MIDIKRFENAVKASGKKKQYLATQLGISRQALYMKIHETRDLKGAEILTLSEELNLTPEERDKIFFAPKV